MWCGVRLRTVDDALWEGGRLEMVRPLAMAPPYVGWVGEMMRTAAVVLAVPTVVDHLARAWSEKVAKGAAAAEGQVAALLLWTLRRLAADEEQFGQRARWRLTRANVPWVVDGRFWKPFVQRYPEALVLLRQCGLGGPAAGGGLVSPPESEVGDGGSIDLRGSTAEHIHRDLLLDAFHPDSYRRREERGERSSGSVTPPSAGPWEGCRQLDALNELEGDLFNLI
ncbi:hypothetical protein VTK26DRAFT_2904 [Humicola hyalothermophila]